MSEPLVITPEPAPMRRPGIWLAGVGIYILLLSIGAAIGGEIGNFTSASLNALPFVGLAILTYFAGTSFNWAWIATGVWLTILIGASAVYAFGLGVLNIVDIPPGGFDPNNPPTFQPEAFLTMFALILGIFGSIGIGLLTLLPPIRRWLAQFLPLDSTSFVHSVALAAIVTLTLIMVMPLLVTGKPPLLTLVRIIGSEELNAGDLSSDAQLRSQIYGLIWTIPAAFLAVGFGIRRNLSATMLRLGLVRPTFNQVLSGLGIGLGLAGLITLILPLMDSIWQTFGWPTTDHEAFSELMAFAISPMGALVIGVTAGLGEELAVRGVLQPRLGILLSNLFFVSLHAFQYHWDGLLVVFAVGMICGLVRKYTNTTTAAIVHGVYNFVLIMLEVIAG
ncbi:MAG: CPBP family intramembrane metalloprotease [Chloroflexus sp.]|nr:CPBP family intramembrane metalloprotease [Chloroflexus sp.]